MVARVLAAMLIVTPTLVLVGLTAAVIHDVRLASWEWAAGFGLLWVASVPFVALGIAIGKSFSSTTAYALSTAIYFALAALGGLWMPPSVFPSTLRHVALALPSYQAADLGWRVVGGSAPSLGDALALLGWSIILTVLASSIGRRAGPRRARRALGPDAAPWDGRLAVSLQAVSKSYGSVPAVSNVNLELPPGSTVALLGPNGAGKTTTIAILLGQLGADSGTVRLLGGPPGRAVAEGRVGVMLQDGQLMDGVRVATLLSVIRRAYPHPADFDHLINAAGIAAFLRRRTDQLSGGEVQRVRFALAAAGEPSLMVLDEPTIAMDVEAREAFWAALEAEATQGRTVLFSTHYLEEAEAHAGRIVILRAGEVVADGTPEQIVSAAGVGRSVRFRTTSLSPETLRSVPGVLAVDVDHDRITLHSSDSDATMWGLYHLRDRIHDLDLVTGGLREAFLALTAKPGPGQRGRRDETSTPDRSGGRWP